MNQKWNLGDIRPSGQKKQVPLTSSQSSLRQDISVRRPRPAPENEPPVIDPDISTIEIIDGKSERKKRILISTAIVVVVLGIGFFLNSLTSGAEVTVYPKFKDITVQATFTAHKEPQEGELSYELLSLDATNEKQVVAKGEQQVSERATGKILIYNTYASASQRLVKNTRFETPDGLIYRIRESVEVPAATKDSKGTFIPGVVSADVFADGTGDQYNIGPTRFSVPGLKGSDQYEKVYGESTDSFAGGFEGPKYMIDENEYNTAKQALQLDLRNALLERLKNERPAGFVLFDTAVTFVFESLPVTNYTNGMATIKEKAILNVPMFSVHEFADYLAQNTIKGFERAPVEMPDPMTLAFKYTSATTSISDLSKAQTIDFDLAGTSRIVWIFDPEAFVTDIVGKPKTALPSIITAYPSITKFEVDIRPFWRGAFPEKKEKITVTQKVGTE